MTFLAPWLLAGGLLAAAPIVIHLLNRRRFTVVDWAPMRYLKNTLRTNRRRLRLEQWVLLAMRALLVLILFVALAQPIAARSGLGGWVAGAERVSRVLVIDDSLSMGLRGGGTSASEAAFDRAKEAAVSLIETLGTQDTLTVFTTSRPDAPLIRNAAVDDPAALVEAVRQLGPLDTADAWAATLGAAREYLAAAPFAEREVTVLTDPRGPGWSTGLGDVANALDAEGAMVRVMDVGRGAAGGVSNVALLSLTGDDAVAVAGEAVPLTATVRLDGGLTGGAAGSLGGGPAGGEVVRAVLSVNGAENAVELPPLPVGEAVSVPLTVTFDGAGPQRLALRLPDDALPGDNARQLVVEARERIDVLLVDGEPAAEARDGETFFLGWALRAGGRPFTVRRAVDSAWLEGAWPEAETPDVLVLANVASLSTERAREVTERVSGGMGLMVFVGDLVEVESYNERLYADGRGVLPGELRPAEDGSEGARGLFVTADPGSALGPLAAVPREQFGGVVAARVMPVAVPAIGEGPTSAISDSAPGRPPSPGPSQGEGGQREPSPNRSRGDGGKAAAGPLASTLMRWSAGWKEAVIERHLGAGRVLLWTTTADRAWSNWPTDPSFVLAVRQGARAVAGRVGGGAGRVNRTVGEALTVGADAGRPPGVATVALPPGSGGSGGGGTVSATVDRGDPAAPVIRYGETERAGFYTVSWEAAGVGPTTGERTFAVNPDAAESDLTPVPAEQIERALAPLAVTVTRLGDPGDGGEEAGNRDLWRTAMLAVLGLVVMESAFAAWVGREH